MKHNYVYYYNFILRCLNIKIKPFPKNKRRLSPLITKPAGFIKREFTVHVWARLNYYFVWCFRLLSFARHCPVKEFHTREERKERKQFNFFNSVIRSDKMLEISIKLEKQTDDHDEHRSINTIMNESTSISRQAFQEIYKINMWFPVFFLSFFIF